MAGKQLPRGAIIEGINVTPLVDIALVLLIIFIVTAKIVVSPAVPLDLPTATHSEEVQTVFAVSIDPAGALQVDGEPCEDEALTPLAAAAAKDEPGLRAVIQADGAVPHRRVIAVLDRLREAGIEKVAFGAVPPEPEAADAP